jgi:L-malate glycosyltransferase
LNLSRMDAPTPANRQLALDRFNLPRNGSRRFITILANIREVKDHATFLRAARRVHAALPETAFLLAGDGPLMGSMVALARELGLERAVFFLGRCDRVVELLQLSDVCVLSSISEGFSNSILEYMAARRPVVATGVGGIPEAVKDGETGYLVPPGDDELMAERIVSLLCDEEKARSMGERGRAIVEERFSSACQRARTERLYARLLAAARNRVLPLEQAGRERECG